MLKWHTERKSTHIGSHCIDYRSVSAHKLTLKCVLWASCDCGRWLVSALVFQSWDSPANSSAQRVAFSLERNGGKSRFTAGLNLGSYCVLTVLVEMKAGVCGIDISPRILLAMAVNYHYIIITLSLTQITQRAWSTQARSHDMSCWWSQ